jgi:hypothetical protein
MVEDRSDDVRTEVRSRRTNEWIRSARRSFGDAVGDADGTDRYHCECSDAGCTSTIALLASEYESVRGDGRDFAIMRDHEDPELDAVLAERARYSIVRKLPGMPARIAGESDPRRPG